jgi:predicted  nucleic acid-binding Zn-ribbon protein
MESELEELRNEIHSLKMEIMDMEEEMAKMEEKFYTQGYEDGWCDYMESQEWTNRL